MPWVYNPHTGGKNIPPDVRARTERRILDYAAKHHPKKFTRIDVRFHGALCYIDVYTESLVPDGSGPPAGETPTHLCRIRYFGNEDRWSFAWYNYGPEKYEPGILMSDQDHGTPEEAFESAAQFL